VTIFYVFYGGFVTIAGELNWALKKSGTIESSVNAFLATGNLYTSSGLGLLQDKGSFHISFNSLFFKGQLPVFGMIIIVVVLQTVCGIG
jgi:hypothetical protein